MARTKGSRNVPKGTRYVVSIHIYEVTTDHAGEENWEMEDMSPLLDTTNYSKAKTMYNRHVGMVEKRRTAAKKRWKR